MRPFCVLINDPAKPSSRRPTAAALNAALNLHKRHFTHFSSLFFFFLFFFYSTATSFAAQLQQVVSPLGVHTPAAHTRLSVTHANTQAVSA